MKSILRKCVVYYRNIRESVYCSYKIALIAIVLVSCDNPIEPTAEAHDCDTVYIYRDRVVHTGSFALATGDQAYWSEYQDSTQTSASIAMDYWILIPDGEEIPDSIFVSLYIYGYDQDYNIGELRERKTQYVPMPDEDGAYPQKTDLIGRVVTDNYYKMDELLVYRSYYWGIE